MLVMAAKLVTAYLKETCKVCLYLEPFSSNCDPRATLGPGIITLCPEAKSYTRVCYVSLIQRMHVNKTNLSAATYHDDFILPLLFFL